MATIQFSKKINIGILITLAGNIFIGGYLISRVISRQDEADTRLTKVEGILDTRGIVGQQWDTRLTMVETEFIDFRKTVEAAILNINTNIEKILDRQYENSHHK